MAAFLGTLLLFSFVPWWVWVVVVIWVLTSKKPPKNRVPEWYRKD